MIGRLTSKLRRAITHNGSAGVEYGTISYSQCGEDVISNYIFQLRGILKPSYLDVGAFHPYYLSNTALFYSRGCRGVNVEPNPTQFALFTKERRADINLNVGIGAREEVLTFYWMDDPTLSTFSKEEANALLRRGKKLSACVELPTVALDQVVKDHCSGRFPDFLTLDTEGLELDVLSTIDFTTSWPKVICVETAEYSPSGVGVKRLDLMRFIESKGYTAYADTNLNTVYVKNQFWLS